MLSQDRIIPKKTQATSPIQLLKRRKKKSTLEISDAIGVYGAFDRTLLELHKQGKY